MPETLHGTVPTIKDRTQVLIDVENQIQVAICALYHAMDVDCNAISVRDVTFIGNQVNTAIKHVSKVAKTIDSLRSY
ncbi:MAG: hypothetical protein ABWY25_01470 [Paenisporosarcina sp.]